MEQEIEIKKPKKKSGREKSTTKLSEDFQKFLGNFTQIATQKLKTFGYFLRFEFANHKLRWGLILLIPLFFIMFTFGTINAQPGDLLFLPKLYWEKTVLYPVSDKLITKIANEQGVLKDRVAAYVNLANRSECVQLLLAEDQISLQVQKLNSFGPDLTDRPTYMNFLKNNAKIVSPLTSLSSNCEITSKLHELEFVYNAALSIQHDPTTDAADLIDTNSLVEQQAKLQTRFDDLRGQLQTAVITDQQKLSQINQLLLTAGDDLETIKSKLDKSESGGILISLNRIDKLLVSAEKTIKNETDLPDWQSDIYAVCDIVGNTQLCASQEIAGSLNSIAGQAEPAQQLNSGETLFTKYLEQIFIAKPVSAPVSAPVEPADPADPVDDGVN